MCEKTEDEKETKYFSGCSVQLAAAQMFKWGVLLDYSPEPPSILAYIHFHFHVMETEYLSTENVLTSDSRGKKGWMANIPLTIQVTVFHGRTHR